MRLLPAYRSHIAAFIVGGTVVLTGCAHPAPPAIGVWQAGSGADQATLTLNPDGKGTLNAAAIPALSNAAVTWTADSQDPTKVTIALTIGASGGPAAGKSVSFLGIVSSDRKTMTLAFPGKTFILSRSPAGP